MVRTSTRAAVPVPTMLFLASAFLSPMVHAQQLTKISVDAERVAPDAAVTVRIDFDHTEKIWCGLNVSFGDGETREVRVEQVPVTLTKTYAKPGIYAIQAEGKFLFRGLRTASSCTGSLAPSPVVVFDPAEEERKRQALAEQEQQARDLEALKQQAEELKQANQKLQAELKKKAAPPGTPAVPTSSAASAAQKPKDRRPNF